MGHAVKMRPATWPATQAEKCLLQLSFGEGRAQCRADYVTCEPAADHPLGSQSAVLDAILGHRHNACYPGVLTPHSDFSSFL